MLSNLGNTFLALNILTTSSIIYFSYKFLKKTILIKFNNLVQLSLLQSTFSIMGFITLITGFLVSDFSLITVFENSHSTKPLFYKIAGAWGNHEGSLLLWITIMTIFSLLFLIFNKRNSNNFLLLTLITQNFLILGFLLFSFFNSNPFDKILPVPLNGLGLNPILQDPALAIHPPLLYLGFVGASIYFSAAISSLLTGHGGKKFAVQIKPWVKISWFFQTLGIIVGSIWAYYELGWGGFWFWDPVENASLMPWFAMTALIHSTIILEKREGLYSWVIILCLLTFILSVTGTFLVRSGILNSVHTFANDPSRGLYILILLFLMVIFSVIIYFSKSKEDNISFDNFSREIFIISNNWFMAFYLITVFIGTIYPIFTEVIFNTKISVGPPFYNLIIAPIVIPFLFIMAIGPNISWIKFKNINKKKIILVTLFSTLIIFLLKKLNGGFSPISNLILISSVFLIIYSLIDLKILLKNRPYNNLSRVISHLGFGFLIFFIVINHNYSIERDMNLKVGDTERFNNYEITFSKLTLNKEENYDSVVGHFIFKDKNNGFIKNLKPEIRLYNKPETLTYEASIRTNIFRDHYLTMSNIDRSEFYNIKFQNKPLMLWIWISAIILSIGGISRLNFFRK
tara:strand:+ start:234 stop:2114 length:1881 start_codon:yes stop_codon:yes gene_type:complete